MSAGETDGIDLAVETLAIINDHWDGVASTFAESSDGGWQYDTQQYDTVTLSSANTWRKPVLRNGDSKTIYPSGSVTQYTGLLRTNDVITVSRDSRDDDPVGTEYDADVTWDLTVECEAMPGSGFSVVGDTTDWRVFVHIVRRAILTERLKPITDQSLTFEWRWLTIPDEGPIPETEDNRNRYGTQLTLRWHGFEALP